MLFRPGISRAPGSALPGLRNHRRSRMVKWRCMGLVVASKLPISLWEQCFGFGEFRLPYFKPDWSGVIAQHSKMRRLFRL